MERVTFSRPKVREEIAKYVAVKINVDRAENRTLCNSYRPKGGIPSYAVVDPKGVLLGQFGGFLEPAPFLKSLANPVPAKPKTAWVAGADLDARIKRNIRKFDEPAPGKLSARLASLLGGKPKTMTEWVDEQNATLDELTRIGEVAVPALLRAVEHGSSRCAERCAVVLGRIKAPAAKKPIAALLTHERAHVRAAAATCMGLYSERAFLPALSARLGQRDEALLVRVEAVGAIRHIAGSYGGIDDVVVATALLDAARADHPRLRWECLQALMSFQSPIDLAALLPLMDDRRDGIRGFSDQTVSANACWVFMGLSGQRIERVDGKEFQGYTPAVIAFIKAWHEREKGNLVWDRERKHYRLRGP